MHLTMEVIFLGSRSQQVVITRIGSQCPALVLAGCFCSHCSSWAAGWLLWLVHFSNLWWGKRLVCFSNLWWGKRLYELAQWSECVVMRKQAGTHQALLVLVSNKCCLYEAWGLCFTWHQSTCTLRTPLLQMAGRIMCCLSRGT